MTLFAADYPFLNILWTMIIFFAWVAWIWVLIVIIGDLFRRHDTSGWVKAAWVVLLIILPFLGVLFYLINNSQGMAERSAKPPQASQAQFNDYVQSVAGSGGRPPRSRRPRDCSTAARSPSRSSTPSRPRRSPDRGPLR